MVSCGAPPDESGDPEATDRWPELSSPVVFSQADRDFVADLLARMNLEQKVGQIIQAEIQSITPEEARDFHIGSILNGGGSWPEGDRDATPADWTSFAQRFYETSSEAAEPAIPVIWGTDAVHGHNNVKGATIFPHNIGLGAANDPGLMTRIGEVTAREVRATGIPWTFGPVVAVVRNDRWGRTYESYSEDPKLVARMAGALITGLQGQLGTDSFLDERHILATAKHFLADGGTEGGDDQGDARIGESELIRVHAPGYIAALNAGGLAVMASYSSWNGQKMHGNAYLLTDVLRGKLDFQGLVVGDWNGHGQVPGCSSDHCAQAINAGVDLIMVPNDWEAMFHNTMAQVQDGTIGMDRLDQAVTRILLVKKALGLFDGNGPAGWDLARRDGVVGSPEHRAVARQAVRESLVLLKNEGGVLPIRAGAHVLVTGDGADDVA
jgi:beta-glucosidase